MTDSYSIASKCNASLKPNRLVKVQKDFPANLYSRFNLTSSGCYLNNMRFRELAIDDMRYLVAKYPDGYVGSESRKLERDA